MITRRSTLAAGAAAILSSDWVRTARADETGTLTVALSNNPVTCDPINMASHDTEILSQTIYENLITVDLNGNMQRQLAKAMPPISADALVYTFDLREDVVFQDGTPLTSADVKYSIEYTINPANKATRGPIFNRIPHVDTGGPHRLHVVLKEPFAPWTYFLYKFMGTWPNGSREKYGNDYFRLSPKNVVTGPGIFEEWKLNDYVSFRRNPSYWQKCLPHWDRPVVKVGIARALAMEPARLVADEPVSVLDVSLQGEIINPLRELNEALGLTIVLISHDLAVIARVCDSIEVLYAGRIVERGAPQDVLTAPRHPYTQALLDVVPRGLHRRERSRTMLPSDSRAAVGVPIPASLPASVCAVRRRRPETCRFGPRP